LNDEKSNQIMTFNQVNHYPYHICEIEVPHFNTGFIYKLVSKPCPGFAYFGEKMILIEESENTIEELAYYQLLHEDCDHLV
jgi:hypothetical protein